MRTRPASALVPLLFLLVVAACGGGGGKSLDNSLPLGGPPAGDFIPIPGTGGDPAPGGGGGTPGGSTLQGGVLVTLVHSGDLFHIWVTAPVSAQTLVDIWSGSVGFVNVTGAIRVGPGEAQHNAPWSWHLDPSSILVNIATFAPVYSGTPSDVEANLAALIAVNSDKMTTNNGSTLQDVQDLR